MIFIFVSQPLFLLAIFQKCDAEFGTERQGVNTNRYFIACAQTEQWVRSDGH